MTAEHHVDGRRRRGELRRQALLDAAVRVIGRDGITGITHRAVAAEAAVPPAAPTYHFRDVDSLLAAALEAAATTWGTSFADIAATVLAAPDAPGALADAIMDLAHQPTQLYAEYELYLVAARKPELRPIALRWTEKLESALAKLGHPPDQVRAVITVIEGVLIQTAVGRTTARADLAAIFRLLLVTAPS